MDELINMLYEKEDKKGFRSLSEVEKNIIVVSSTLGAIDNGGFTDLCVNYSGNYINQIPKSLAAIGAHEASELLTKFVSWFGSFKPSRLRWLRELQFNFRYPKLSAEFDAIDEAWDSSKLQIEQHLEQYINANYK
tara:strand:- start:128 stop:532 length:405 start_codon:yes stop_codon:yes gene_type:complete